MYKGKQNLKKDSLSNPLPHDLSKANFGDWGSPESPVVNFSQKDIHEWEQNSESQKVRKCVIKLSNDNQRKRTSRFILIGFAGLILAAITTGFTITQYFKAYPDEIVNADSYVLQYMFATNEQVLAEALNNLNVGE